MMKKINIIILLFSVCIILPVISKAQQKGTTDISKKYNLQSDKLDEQGRSLDGQILELNNKIAKIIKKYNLLNTTGIRVVPFQTTYNLGKNFIEIEKHLFIRSMIYNDKISGIQTKKIKIYTNGQTVTKIESEVYEKDYNSSEVNHVFISDPSPVTSGTDDVVFTHIFKGRTILDKKKLGDVKNTTAYPIRNDLKSEFLVPHLTIFFETLRFIAGAYYKSLKDADTNMADFLKHSTRY